LPPYQGPGVELLVITSSSTCCKGQSFERLHPRARHGPASSIVENFLDEVIEHGAIQHLKHLLTLLLWALQAQSMVYFWACKMIFCLNVCSSCSGFTIYFICSFRGMTYIFICANIIESSAIPIVRSSINVRFSHFQIKYLIFATSRVHDWSASVRGGCRRRAPLHSELKRPASSRGKGESRRLRGCTRSWLARWLACYSRAPLLAGPTSGRGMKTRTCAESIESKMRRRIGGGVPKRPGRERG
jgi:hypothetical protein